MTCSGKACHAITAFSLRYEQGSSEAYYGRTTSALRYEQGCSETYHAMTTSAPRDCMNRDDKAPILISHVVNSNRMNLPFKLLEENAHIHASLGVKNMNLKNRIKYITS